MNKASFSSETRFRFISSAGLFLSFLFIYGFSHEKIYYFDSVLFAGTIEGPLRILSPNIIFEWNHFLWLPTGRAFYLVVNKLGWHLRGYEALQWLSTIVGAAGVALGFLLLSRRAPTLWAFMWTLLFAFSTVYWHRSIGGENHLLGAFWLIPFCSSATRYLEQPKGKSLIGAGLFAALSTFYHTGNVVVWLAVAVMPLFAPSKKRVQHLAMVSMVFVAMMLLYGWVHGWFSADGFQRWWLWSLNLAQGISPAESKSGGFRLSFFFQRSRGLRGICQKHLVF